jgi:hypothetical protein
MNPASVNILWLESAETRGLPAHRYMNHSLCQHPWAGLQGQGASLLTGTGPLVINPSLCYHPRADFRDKGPPCSQVQGVQL